ncbi:MAG: hypothetical protein ABR589_04615 [Chthoniobacterales bacterium]
MKPFIAIVSSSLLLCSCADMYVTRTDVATAGGGSSAAVDPKDYGSVAGVRFTTNCGVGAHDPKAIYIRPFCIDNASFTGHQTASEGEMPLRKALTPVSFAQTLKESLEKMAPARILKDDETPRTGWLVEGEFRTVDGGGLHSHLSMHVRITDVDRGLVIYEFDVAGGNRGQGPFGTVRASGLGRATPFDLVNAAERIYLALTPNVHRYGTRSSLALE